MIYAILGSGIASLGLIGTIAILLYRAQRETMHIRDLLDAKDDLADQYQHERDVEVAAHAVTSAQLKEARERLAVAESQRNDAFRDARDHFVERIKESNAETATDLVSDLLAHVWPSVRGVSQVPQDDNTGTGNNLIDPAKL